MEAPPILVNVEGFKHTAVCAPSKTIPAHMGITREALAYSMSRENFSAGNIWLRRGLFYAVI
jgi:hypothetical protein